MKKKTKITLWFQIAPVAYSKSPESPESPNWFEKTYFFTLNPQFLTGRAFKRGSK